MSTGPTNSGSPTLQELFIQNRSDLIRAARAITGCHYWAEDVVHDAFIRIVEISEEDEVKQPTSYLFRVVRNLAIDKFRRLALEARHNNESNISEAPIEKNCPESIAFNQDLLHRISNALQELPERTRNVFEMHRLKGVTQKQIASDYEISPTLVNFIVRDATNYCALVLD